MSMEKLKTVAESGDEPVTSCSRPRAKKQTKQPWFSLFWMHLGLTSRSRSLPWSIATFPSEVGPKEKST